jgi:hypothetical protein
MCLSCGCGRPYDDRGDRRNITMSDLDRAAEAAGTTRDKVIQNIIHATGTQRSGVSTTDQRQQGAPDQSSGGFLPSEQPQRHPGEYSPQLGQESGSAWQESQQMGKTGHGGVQKPNE